MLCESRGKKVCLYTPGRPAAIQAQAKESGFRWGEPLGVLESGALPALGKGCPGGQAGAQSEQGTGILGSCGALALRVLSVVVPKSPTKTDSQTF